MACEVCHKSYVWNAENEDLDSDAKPHVCTTCGQSFSLKIQLKRHTMLHADGESYVCINCTKNGENQELKSYNLRLSKKGEYPCDSCGESFVSKRMLLRHTTKEHCLDNGDLTDESLESAEEVVVVKKRGRKPKNASKKSLPEVEYKCTTSNPNSEQKAEKDSSKNLNKKLLCHTCNKNFAYQACLDKHVKKANCKPARRVINLSIKFKNTDDNDDTSDKKHVCNVCGKSFTRKTSLEGHIVTHLKEKFCTADDGDYYSEQDEDSDEYVSEPKKPRISKIKIQKSYTCDSCNFVCFSKQTLDKHLNNHREKEETNATIENPPVDILTYVCTKCEEKFKTEEELQKHSEVHSSKSTEKPADEGPLYQCEICLKQFRTKGRLKRHLLFHVTEVTKDETNEDYPCIKCEERFKTTDDLHQHLDVHTKRLTDKPEEEDKSGPYQCEICSKEFRTKGRLKRHLLFHVTRSPDEAPRQWNWSRKKRSKDFACEVCGKRFAGKTCLQKHSLRHIEGETETPPTTTPKKKKVITTMVCEFCNEEFTGKRGAYIKHVHSHTPEVCGICDERFVDRQGLREHCKIHIGTEEGRMFMECSQKALDAKNGLLPPEPKVEYIYLVLR